MEGFTTWTLNLNWNYVERVTSSRTRDFAWLPWTSPCSRRRRRADLSLTPSSRRKLGRNAARDVIYEW